MIRTAFLSTIPTAVLIRGGLLTPVQARNLVRSLEAGPYGSSLPERYEAMVQALREWSGGSTSVYWVGPGTAGSVQGLQDGDLAESGVPVTKSSSGQGYAIQYPGRLVSLAGAVTGGGGAFYAGGRGYQHGAGSCLQSLCKSGSPGEACRSVSG